MHGLIFAGLRDYSAKRLGEERAAELWLDRTFEPTEAYDDAWFAAQVKRLAAATGESADDVQRGFGSFAAQQTFVALFPAYYEQSADTFAFLLGIEEKIHEVVRATIRGASPPKLHVHALSDLGVLVTYTSERGLCKLLEGLVLGRRRTTGTRSWSRRSSACAAATPAASSRWYGRNVADPALPLTGGCGCGAVRFEIREPLVSASYCHCTRCRRRTGTAASANGRAAPGSFHVVAGEEHLRAWAPEGGAEKVFCAVCGSALFSRSEADPPRIGVRLGAIDADPGIRPQWHQYVDYAAAWEEIPDDGLPRYPEGKT